MGAIGVDYGYRSHSKAHAHSARKPGSSPLCLLLCLTRLLGLVTVVRVVAVAAVVVTVTVVASAAVVVASLCLGCHLSVSARVFPGSWNEQGRGPSISQSCEPSNIVALLSAAVFKRKPGVSTTAPTAHRCGCAGVHVCNCAHHG